MLGMNFYAAVFVSALALLGYRFCITKMPAPIAFISQMVAIGLCWCPPVIIYNYLTYFFFLLGAILLFRGLAGERSSCLVLAGVCLGLNIFVRNPNILEAALIICVWYYAFLRRKKIAPAVRETLLCLAGYVGAILTMCIVMMIHYDAEAPLKMVDGLFKMSASNSAYTFGGMLWAIISAYLSGAKWLFYMALCILPGIPFMQIRLSGLFGDKISEEKITFIKKIVYCLAIGFLFYGFSRIGMYNFRYYQKESALQWAVVFLLISLANMVGMLYSKTVDVHWKLIAAIGIVIIIITPLGSNNHVWPIINNLFFIAPITIWRVYRFARYGRRYLGTEQAMVPLFPLKAMQMAIIIAVFVQSLGVGIFYVFRDGENGEARNATITESSTLRGMRTSSENAANLQEIINFLARQPEDERDLILFGDIPALSYYLNRPTALSSSWPDLDTFSIAQFANELEDVSVRIEVKGRSRPLLIINADVPARDAVREKKVYLDEFSVRHNYKEVFRNEQFIIYG
jgi:hypothetical protein